MIDSDFPTVYIPVKGGLGNQMFFYAFGLYLKNKGVNSLLVWHEYIFTKQHNGVEFFEAFAIQLDTQTNKLISFFVGINNSNLPFLFKRILGRIFRFKYTLVSKYQQSSPYSFDDVFSSINGRDIYMDGFWQNHLYLNSIRADILKTYQFKLPENFLENSFFQKIRSCNSVSIHIRRGDYLDAEFSELNVINSINYYLRAIEFVKKNCLDPIFFIFTDDMIWAKKEFSSIDVIFIEGRDNHPAHLDLFLMTQCKHNIIANSTFSWWGAWLNENPSKIVVTPNMWTKKVPSTLLCPPEWVYLEVL